MVCTNLEPEVEKMKDLARRASREHVEFGAPIKEDWKLGTAVSGQHNKVVITRKPGDKGTYHTHKLETRPSVIDQWSMIFNQQQAMCIGEAKVAQPTVTCHFPERTEDFKALGIAARMAEEDIAVYMKRLEDRYGKAEVRTEMERLEGTSLLRRLRQVKETMVKKWPDIVGSCPM
jgi:hypothetical protein